MGKPVIPIAYQFTAAEIASGDANNLPKGTSIIIIDANGQPTDIKVAQGGGQAPTDSSGLKNNFAATAAPTTSNDSTQGYAIGSRWIDATNNESYICTKAINPASWSQTTVGNISEVSGLQGALDAKAPLASPTFSGAVSGITKSMVGLGSVDDTSDSLKPVSTATQIALNLKSPLISPTFTGTLIADSTVRLGNGQNLGDSGGGLTDATTLYPNVASTAITTIQTTDTAFRVARTGTSGTKWGNVMDVNIGSHTAGLNSSTQIDFRLSNGGTNNADITILSLKGDGSVLANGSQVIRQADVNNTLTSTLTTVPLSAAQGKALQDNKSDISHTHSRDFTDWTVYTPVITSESGGWTNYTATGRYKIVDRMLTVSFRVIFNNTSAAASALYVSLPSGLTMNGSVMTGGASWDTDLIGFGILGDSGTISGVPAIITTRTNQKIIVKYYYWNGTYVTCPGLSNAVPWIWTTNDTIDGQFTVPIL